MNDVAHSIDNLSSSTDRVADAITANAAPNTDAQGGTVTSLTEAVMGVTAGMDQIAGSLDAIAEAIHALATVHANED